MKKLISITIVFLTITLLGHAYGQTEEQKVIQLGIMATQSANLLNEANGITDTCTMLVNFGQVTTECMNYVKDFRDAIKGVVDKYRDITSNSFGNSYYP